VASDMVRFDGVPVGGCAPHQMVQRGLAMVPEGRRLFTGMSVEDNLRVAIDHARKPGTDRDRNAPRWTIERLHALFPILKDKRRTPVESLSGGQQQMVAIARGLLSQPRLLLCDELSLGLAPLVIREIYAALPGITAAGTAIVLVEQDVALACRASNRLYCMLEGRITLTGRSADTPREAIARAYFGAGHAVA
jgi:branched-chain amino acid transport system ATP-binding protein